MYLFISGYTSTVTVTEAGVTNLGPDFGLFWSGVFTTSSYKICNYVGNKLKESGANVWLMDPGMTGSGVGSRMSLKYTRALITAALSGELNKVAFETIPVKLQVPTECPNVPSEILNPRNHGQIKKLMI